MKRKVALFALIAAVAVLVPVLAVLAQSQPQCLSSGSVEYCQGAACGKCCKAKQATCEDDKVVEELMAILKETKSSDTFVVTAVALGRMGSKAKRAVPTIIRNAERLEILEGICDATTPASETNEMQMVWQAINWILDKKGSTKSPVHTQPACAPAPVSMGYGGACAPDPLTPSSVPTPAPCYITPGSSYCSPTMTSPPATSSPSSRTKKSALPTPS